MNHLKEYCIDEGTIFLKIFLKTFALRNSSYYICYEFLRIHTMRPNNQITNKLSTAWAVYHPPGVPLHFARENQQPSRPVHRPRATPSSMAHENQQLEADSADQPTTNN